MLLYFKVSNYKSFSDEAMLNLVPVRRIVSFPDHLHKMANNESVSAVGTAVVFGANASGKTNLVLAMDSSQSYIVRGVLQDKDIPCASPFLLDKSEADTGSRFEYGLCTEGHVYNYGFVVKKNIVVEEWLFESMGNSEKRIFERGLVNGEIKFEFGKELEARFANTQVAAVVSDKVLFLTVAGQKDKLLAPVYLWFRDHLMVIPASERLVCTNLSDVILNHKHFKQFMDELLRTFDTGVFSFNIEKQDSSNYKPITIHKRADLSEIPFDLGMESDGTRQLMNLAPFLFQAKQEEKVVVIDELDRSLHSALTRRFIELFHQLAGSSSLHSQLIVTTHDTNLLDSNFLRKDEIWFMKKTSIASSQLVCLAEYKVTQGLNFEKGYLAGRFGAIPNLSDLVSLIKCPPGDQPFQLERIQHTQK